MKNMPIMNMHKIIDEIKDTFTGICNIVSIKPLYFAGTKILTDQWQVTLDITDKEYITEKIPRTVIFLGRKVNLSWKNAPTICFFCEKSGHFKKDYPDLKETKKNCNLLEKLKNVAKEIETTTSLSNEDKIPITQSENTSQPKTIPSKDGENNVFLEKLSNLIEKKTTYLEPYINISSNNNEKTINTLIIDTDNDTSISDEQESEDMQTDDNEGFTKVTSKRRNCQSNSPNLESIRATRNRKEKKQCRLESIGEEKIFKK